MKLTFDWKNDGEYHQYCANCFAEAVSRVYKDSKTYYFCDNCRKTSERSIVIDPAIKWWVENDNEYWHESSGVFIRNADGKFLFFERLIYPFALTVPSGHVDAGEDALDSAKREVFEEVGLKTDSLTALGVDDIKGDSCRRGSDVHRWHSYKIVLDDKPRIDVKEEGGSPVWLSLSEAREKDLVFPVKYVINQYYDELSR